MIFFFPSSILFLNKEENKCSVLDLSGLICLYWYSRMKEDSEKGEIALIRKTSYFFISSLVSLDLLRETTLKQINEIEKTLLSIILVRRVFGNLKVISLTTIMVLISIVFLS